MSSSISDILLSIPFDAEIMNKLKGYETQEGAKLLSIRQFALTVYSGVEFCTRGHLARSEPYSVDYDTGYVTLTFNESIHFSFHCLCWHESAILTILDWWENNR